VRPVLEGADLVLHLIPVADPGPDPMLTTTLAPFVGRVLEVRTFGDQAPGPGTVISALLGDLDALEVALRDRLLGGLAPDACLGALATDRQVELLDDLVRQVDLLCGLDDSPPELPASLLQGAWGLLARLTGEDRAESALDALFSGFCLGK
jgi:tRNA modification GTPase